LAGENGKLAFTHLLRLSAEKTVPLNSAKFFAGSPTLALVAERFYIVRNAPPTFLLDPWVASPVVPVTKLSNRFRSQLRRAHAKRGADWDQLCISHAALPQFVFELNEETVRLRLLARSERDQSLWHWTGQEWQLEQPAANGADKPQILEDARLDAAVTWLRRLDWFTPEPGVWVGDANE